MLCDLSHRSRYKEKDCEGKPRNVIMPEFFTTSSIATFLPKDPLVSIITVTYNHEKFIRRCLESTTCQTYSNWEQIIIDDGSTDSTWDILCEFQDKRISIFRQNHRGFDGAVETHNDALSRAKGELVTCLDGDDYWSGHKLERQVRAFEDVAIVLAYCPATVVRRNGSKYVNIRNIPRKSALRNNNPPGSILPPLLFGNFIPAGSVITRKSALDAIGGFIQIPGRTGTWDYGTWLHISLLGKFSYTDEPLFYYQKHHSQATNRIGVDAVLHQWNYVLWFANTKVGNRALENKLAKQREISVESARVVEGRRLLIERKWEDARKTLLPCLKSRWPIVRFNSGIGVIASLVHRDVESIARLARRDTIN